MDAGGIPQNWKNWILQNLLRGVKAEQLLSTLLENGYTFEASKKALGSNLPASISHPKDAAFFKRVCQPVLWRDPASRGASIVEDDRVQMLVVENFLSKAECDEIIALAKTKLRPSEISAQSGYEGFRTSTTCDLPYLNHPAADAVDKKIIDCLGVGVGENEVIQAQHYDVGQEFKAHTDYFEPGSDEYKRFCKDGGQRTWTFMVYLNDACEGGQTEFPLLKRAFVPKTGMALVWNNLHENGTPNDFTLHHAYPITAGEKVVITKWFREEKRG